jgi:hypothetical protein
MSFIGATSFGTTNADNVTLQKSGNTIAVKDSGIGTTQIDDGAIVSADLSSTLARAYTGVTERREDTTDYTANTGTTYATLHTYSSISKLNDYVVVRAKTSVEGDNRVKVTWNYEDTTSEEVELLLADLTTAEVDYYLINPSQLKVVDNIVISKKNSFPTGNSFVYNSNLFLI